jgi:hypothetical protein
MMSAEVFVKRNGGLLGTDADGDQQQGGGDAANHCVLLVLVLPILSSH